MAEMDVGEDDIPNHDQVISIFKSPIFGNVEDSSWIWLRWSESVVFVPLLAESHFRTG